MWRQDESVILIYDCGCGGGGRTQWCTHHSSEHILGLSLSFSACQMGILTPLTGLWWGRREDECRVPSTRRCLVMML